ncbi:hypothetical protein TCAL_03257 [Tigriopus californicus]|uniref:CDP-diacylglycerol--inositol 3-phosphatidyltransferase n=1 Tax=Tigriopus californicus TaxID=6832 RepID=A0A553NVL5_TIGCA|nr:CDP-diacylglycerol--inositol 3-phosphatidyltransferase-like [Tigriopus californicus]XP_059082467.1 CDP-diacylglycerol--inositol 3-phosphatidyltransferase-like [Tigriopus californicus]XP_059082477.1 CDP-diacylglycerol--inositol 3-phosphatidyltransferase-like [Tigriopus californicus]TRY69475.1 hypothetical protein TCAL_03257 [Tigriopus californicus]|eukprot:TCALIF_03257-PA protein Name:"Similar to CDIPT CDP-diacylglycerol--inositol 3-phosphatidyltransferase (Homo sapiens)" AED:0.18 eAED:0.18 QI:27/1/1/1/1/1/4/269/229
MSDTSKMDSPSETAKADRENIFMFVPNLIGYGRVILAIISFWFMPTNHVISAWCYILSGLLDAFDGHAARMFNQSTKFGAMLDMLTDRCATMALLATLCTFYPAWTFFFQLSMIIDVSCHWIHLHASLLQGATSHKFVSADGNPIMHIYYTSRPVLFGMCAGNEIFYASLYLLHFTNGPFYLFYITAVACFPIAVAKSGIAMLQGYLACLNLGGVDVEERKKLAEAKST